MDAELDNKQVIWNNINDLEIIPGQTLSPTLCKTTRQIPCLLKPGTIESLKQIVTVARENKIPIYPISRGKNWGYGAHLPVENGCTVVSLERLNKIGPCDPDSGKIYLEPGVSQEELFTYLKNNYPQFTFNVTGAGKDTSIIGNCLERGLGYFQERSKELHGMKVLTISGEVIEQNAECWKPWHPAGVGMLWEGLFSQSNLGIVLGGWFSLYHKQEDSTFLSLENSSLTQLITDFKKLYENNLLTTVSHVGDPTRKQYVFDGLVRKSLPELSEKRRNEVVAQFANETFSGLTVLHGRKSVNKVIVRDIRKLVSSSTKVIDYKREKLDRLKALTKLIPLKKFQNYAAFIEAGEDLLDLCSGIPSDIGLLSIQKTIADPNLSPEGAYYLNATLPPQPEKTETIIKLLEGCRVKTSTTFIMKDAHCISTIITFHFDPQQHDYAKQELRSFTSKLIENGFPPYRAGIDQMDQLSYSTLNAKLKGLLDPENLISPGRYS